MMELLQVAKVYQKNSQRIAALENITLTINRGEFILVCGPSGSGKSTLLLTLGAMIQPSSGAVCFNGREIHRATEKERTLFRRQHLGFVFQMFNLLPYMTVLENVLMGQVLRQTGDEATARQWLERLHLQDRLQHKPAELSVGECQRVAMARALIKNPHLLLADEPTGNLDGVNADQILAALSEYHRQGGTVVMVTHGSTGAIRADRTVYLEQGRLVA
ncbi:MAG: putative ABC transporter ATP-binding protein [bacterium ADurb.Bin478]|nr:MAG: putative ABC transporter ATP-binding protein [bacterium ADurb.Bin478]